MFASLCVHVQQLTSRKTGLISQFTTPGGEVKYGDYDTSKLHHIYNRENPKPMHETPNRSRVFF